MQMPTRYSDDFLGHGTDLVDTYPDGTPITPRVYSLLFPPVGFFPFYGLGNGDYYGFYWPVGRENKQPLVAFSSHDVGSIIPEYSGIEALYRCQLARTCNTWEDVDVFRQLAEKATGRASPLHLVRDLPVDSYEDFLAIDPDSPFFLCAAADVDVGKDRLDQAEERYRRSIELIPEYIAGHFGLACILRRLRRHKEASRHLRETLLGPTVFHGGSFWADTCLPGTFRNDWLRKSLMWLQRSMQGPDDTEEDPFLEAVGDLTFKTGLARNPDMDLLLDLVERYAASGRYMEAARVWQLRAERASFETSTFRERYGLTPKTFGTRFAELLELGGNSLRAALVGNMLDIMDKPDGYRL